MNGLDQPHPSRTHHAPHHQGYRAPSPRGHPHHLPPRQHSNQHPHHAQHHQHHPPPSPSAHSSQGYAQQDDAHWQHGVHPLHQQHSQHQQLMPQPPPSPQQSVGSDNIKVVVRVRPISHQEAVTRDAEIVETADDARSLDVVVPGPRGSTLSRQYAFHGCIGPHVAQPEMFSMIGMPQLLEACVQGYACTVFAYGQTGSGKTYTMTGHEDSIVKEHYQGDESTDGLITRSLKYLFDAKERNPDKQLVLRASYLEVYNEQVYDLLGPPGSAPLPVRWDAPRGFFVPGLTLVDLATLQDAMHMVRIGTHARRVGSHEMNKDSSRSHSMLTVHVECTTSGEGGITTTFGKVAFVDLAGSERLTKSKSSGETLKETGSINRSLCALGKVITALAEAGRSGTDAGFIPFRDSKLTMLLMDSLGGEALALMIATCSPSARHVEETLSTLNYATHAKSIRNRPTVRLDPQEQMTRALKREIQFLREENGALREQLAVNGISPTPTLVCAPLMSFEGSGGGGGGGCGGTLQRTTSSSGLVPMAGGSMSRLSSAGSFLRLHLDPLPTPSTSSGNDGSGLSPEHRGSSGGPLGTLPPNLASLSKQELVRRLQATHAALGQYAERAEAAEGMARKAEAAALALAAARAENARLEGRLEHLEAVFVTSRVDGTADAFGVSADSLSTEALARTFPPPRAGPPGSVGAGTGGGSGAPEPAGGRRAPGGTAGGRKGKPTSEKTYAKPPSAQRSANS